MYVVTVLLSMHTCMYVCTYKLEKVAFHFPLSYQQAKFTCSCLGCLCRLYFCMFMLRRVFTGARVLFKECLNPFFVYLLFSGGGLREREDNRLLRGRSLVSGGGSSSSGNRMLRERLLRGDDVLSVAPPSGGRSLGLTREKPKEKKNRNMPSSVNNLLRRGSSGARWADGASICHTVPGLTLDQLELCLRTPDAAAVAVAGIQMAVTECAHQMANHRWNCSSLQGTSNPHATHLLQKGKHQR